MYYFIELAGSITNIALLSLFMSRLFVRNRIQSKWHYAFLALLCTGQCALSLFPNWVIPRTLYLLLGGFLLARLFYEVQTWPAAFASGFIFCLRFRGRDSCDVIDWRSSSRYGTFNAGWSSAIDLRCVL